MYTIPFSQRLLRGLAAGQSLPRFLPSGIGIKDLLEPEMSAVPPCSYYTLAAPYRPSFLSAGPQGHKRDGESTWIAVLSRASIAMTARTTSDTATARYSEETIFVRHCQPSLDAVYDQYCGTPMTDGHMVLR